MEAYRRAFIATGSFEPVKHVMVRARVPRLAPRPIPKTDPLNPRRRDPPPRPPPRRDATHPLPAARLSARARRLVRATHRSRAPPHPPPSRRQAGVFPMAPGWSTTSTTNITPTRRRPTRIIPPAAARRRPGGERETAVDAGLPPAAAAALAEPLPGNVDDLTEEIKSLRAEIATLRQGIRVAADAASEAKKKK